MDEWNGNFFVKFYLAGIAFFCFSPLAQVAYHVYDCDEITAGGSNYATCDGDFLQFDDAGFATAQTVTPDTNFTWDDGHFYYVKIYSEGSVGTFQVLLAGSVNETTGYFDYDDQNVQKMVVGPSGAITVAIGFPGTNTDALIKYFCLSEDEDECPDYEEGGGGGGTIVVNDSYGVFSILFMGFLIFVGTMFAFLMVMWIIGWLIIPQVGKFFKGVKRLGKRI